MQCWRIWSNGKILDAECENHFSLSNLNDYYLRVEIWEELMVLSFKMNQQNYARSGTYYLTQMMPLNSTHPGAHEEIHKKAILVCRNNTDIRKSIDGTGKQTFMRNSKTAGNKFLFFIFGEDLF